VRKMIKATSKKTLGKGEVNKVGGRKIKTEKVEKNSTKYEEGKARITT